MLQADAIRILARLKAAFPTMELDEAQTEVLVRELALLHDPLILDEAVTHLIQREDRFPPIARIRLAYRSVNDAAAAARMALEASERPSDATEVPEWVQVWWWHLNRTSKQRKAANRERFPLCEEEKRPPVRMRGFPQEAVPGDDPYTMDEYEQIRQEWIEDGSPFASAWDIIPAA